MSFNTVGEEDVEALVNDRAKCQKYSSCGRSNNTEEKCPARYHNDGTMLHNMEEIKEVDYDINSEVSTAMSTKHEDPCAMAMP